MKKLTLKSAIDAANAFYEQRNHSCLVWAELGAWGDLWEEMGCNLGGYRSIQIVTPGGLVHVVQVPLAGQRWCVTSSRLDGSTSPPQTRRPVGYVCRRESLVTIIGYDDLLTPVPAGTHLVASYMEDGSQMRKGSLVLSQQLVTAVAIDEDPGDIWALTDNDYLFVGRPRVPVEYV